ncbi:MAG: methionyl-tRNA formyltransferase [Tissierellia bacterium]|nr:methionyl-tRNA formyltransferase [Tissierellia bacterium]
MKLIFMGTSDFSLGILKKLHENHEVLAVVTQEDRPRGRGKKLHSPPVKVFCDEEKIRCFQYLPTVEELELFDAKAMVVAAFGRILPLELLNLYEYGAINVHTSLLPKYRGASPIQTSLMEGDKLTGVSIMKMAEGMDTGGVYSQVEVETGNLRYGELEDKLMEASIKPLLDTLEKLETGRAYAEPQDESLASYCKKILKEDSLIDWSRTSREIEGQVRALWPNPMAYTSRKGDRLLLHRAKALDLKALSPPGIVEKVDKKGIYVATGQGQILITELQRSGKRPLMAEEYLRGNPLEVGEKLGG